MYKVLFFVGGFLITEWLGFSEVTVLDINHQSLELFSKIIIQETGVFIKHLDWSLKD